MTSSRGWLRLRWSYSGKRYSLAPGLPDDPINRALAQQKAQQIETDLRAENLTPGAFDLTLAKYRSDSTQPISVVQLWERYIEHKHKTLPDARSLEKYRGLLEYLHRYFRTRAATAISELQAFEFRDWLLERLEPITARERIGMLRSSWGWGIKRKLVTENPWADVKVKVPPKAKPKPFTEEEVQKILEHARSEARYQHWADFIEFCLSIGCRPGEAAGLKWQHLSDDCSSIWIGESFGRGRQKGTKTNQSRAFQVFPELQALLLKRRPEKWGTDEYVFSAPRGSPVDDHNFRRRCWTPLLDELGIPYRKPYTTRHTFTSHALNQGWSISEIAAVTGNSEETILRNYVGNPYGKTKVKRLF
ncbi:MAG: tyrosine-type recombinase/integrase [Leptolyngbya sp. SIO1D8]|nr:tyrosine-type recombinase/integrase [Leptolyngbya sp. SIO1D8]